MTNDFLNIAIALGVIVIVFTLIILMDKRVKKNGPLFTKNPSKSIRAIAVILGLLFLAFYLLIYFAVGEISLTYIVLAGLLFAYGFGANSILDFLQIKNQTITPPPLPENGNNTTIGSLETKGSRRNRLTRFLVNFTIICIASVLLILASYWASTHKENPYSQWVVVGVIILYIIFFFGKYILEIIGIIRNK